jgi:hypothetical protein
LGSLSGIVEAYNTSMFRVGVVILLMSAPAYADYPPVVDRNYAIELYDGVALGNAATIAMGGTSVAYGTGSWGTLQNPSASVVKATTEHGTWSWDYHIDYLNSSLSTDYDNNGIVAAAGGDTTAFTFGLSIREADWAIAGTVSTEQSRIDGAMTTNGDDLYSSTTRAQLALAHWIPEAQVAVGGGIVVARFDLTPNDPSADPLFAISGTGIEAGLNWIPQLQSIRLGGSVTTGIDGGKVETTTCDPNDCQGYILPNKVVAPWRARVGAAYRIAPSAWNQIVPTDFRDEEALILAADVDVTGASDNAYGLEAFGLHELQPAGTHASVSVRGGAEYECVPGRLRVRAGTYWEPGRFDGVSGRMHGTFGIEVRALAFSLWGHRRGRLTLTGDVAERYRNVSISIGFWH